MVMALLMGAGCNSNGDNGSNGIRDSHADTNGTSSQTGSTTDSQTAVNTDSNNDTDTIDDTNDDTDECAALPYAIEINPINMLIVLDRSYSMHLSHVGGDTDNPNDTYAAVVSDALKQVVSTYDATDLINFGLAVFPAMDCPAGEDEPSEDVQCKPASSPESPLVEIAADNSQSIEDELDAVGTCGGTPISASLTWAKTYIDSLPTEIKAQDTYVLLATDGAPNCNPDNSYDVDRCECTTAKTPQNTCPSKILCLDDKATYNAAYQLKSNGSKVFVIGVGDQLAQWDSVMDKIAYWGGTGAYYPANNPATLSAVLETITGAAVECTFDVDWTSVPTFDDEGTLVDKKCNKVRVFGVTKSGQKETINYSFGCEDSKGWQWKGLDKEMDPDVEDKTPLDQCGTIELCPDACKELKQAIYSTVTASFGCGLIPVQ